MNILYIGDIMGEPGMKVVESVLPKLRKERHIDLVIAQAENVSGGKGMLPADMRRLQAAGVNFFTGGNHTPKREELHPLLKDPAMPVIGPANLRDCPGPGWKWFTADENKVLIVSILGDIFGNNPPAIDNPLKAIDDILKTTAHEKRQAAIVNFHGDYSSQKRVIGYYLDGRVTAVIGDHWHVPTADAMVLPKGIAHITDVGMCGVLHSSLGVELDTIIQRWREGRVNRNELATKGPLQFNAVFIESDNKTGLALSITQISMVLS